jgi:predicted O-linked N-acetylglucosamine transferase (SPINDLY family)
MLIACFISIVTCYFFCSLDTFPYAGTTTTCESLYMGVPCVTMAGSVHAHNVGVSLLSNVGMKSTLKSV